MGTMTERTSGETPLVIRAQHTPGPWEIRDSALAEGALIYSAEGYGIGKAWDINGNPENQANARLIAAAPDLLFALKLVLSATYSKSDGSIIRFADLWEIRAKQVEEAIRAATGIQITSNADQPGT